MPTCSVTGCKNRSENAKERKIQFFSFPKNKETALKWMQAANKNKVNLKNARICSVHFTPSCYKPKPAYLANCENYSPKRLRTLHDHAIPTENLPLVKEKVVLKEERIQQNIISENSSFSEFEENLIDASIEIKAEPYFTQSLQENASFTSASDEKMENTQSNSQTVKSEQLSFFSEFETNLIDTSMEVKTEPYFMQSLQENASASDEKMVNTQSNSQTVKSELSFFSEFETNLIDTSMEIKTEPYFMQSPQENASFTSASDETMVNAQSNSQTVMSEHLRYQEIIKNLNTKLSKANKKNDLLKKKLNLLQTAKITVTKRVIKENVHNVLKKIFTPKQIDVLINNEKRKAKWGPEDISAAITLRNISPEAYRFLREKHYPLPGLSTLRNWKRRNFISC